MGKQKQRKRSNSKLLENGSISESGEQLSASETVVKNATEKKVVYCNHVSKVATVTKLKKFVTFSGKCQKCSTSKDKTSGADVGTKTESSSVWMCLHCGAQACGLASSEKHYDEHFKAQRTGLSHCVALILDNLELWCCECNTDITQSPSVASQKAKVDSIISWVRKSMPPLHYESKLGTKVHQTKSADQIPIVQETIRTNAVAKQVSQTSVSLTAHLKGLTNLGNTCFFNSVLQNLAQTYLLLSAYTSDVCSSRLLELQPILNGHRLDIVEELTKLSIKLPNERGQLTSALINAVHQMMNNNGRVFNPSELFSQVCRKVPRFKGFQQQDSHELLRYLLEGLKTEEITCCADTIYSAISKYAKSEETKQYIERQIKLYLNSYNGTIIDQVFGGKMISSVMCLSCKNVATIIEPFLDISLPLITAQDNVPKNKPSPCTSETSCASKPAVSKHQEKKARRESKKKSKKQSKKEQCSLSEGSGQLVSDAAVQAGVSQEETNCANALGNLSLACPLIPVFGSLLENEAQESVSESTTNETPAASDSSVQIVSHSEVSCLTASAGKSNADDSETETEDCCTNLPVVSAANDDDFSVTLAPDSAHWRTKCSLGSCLAHFTATEFLTGGNKFGCEHCSCSDNENEPDSGSDSKSSQTKKRVKYVDAKKRVLIHTPPCILTLHLKRFEQVGYSLRKANQKVEFPVVLDIAPFTARLSCLPAPDKVLYSLYGVIEHSGRLTGGHYVAYVKLRPQNIELLRLLFKHCLAEHKCDQDVQNEVHRVEECLKTSFGLPQSGAWFYISDTQVSAVSVDKVLESQAYLLFYERL